MKFSNYLHFYVRFLEIEIIFNMIKNDTQSLEQTLVVKGKRRLNILSNPEKTVMLTIYVHCHCGRLTQHKGVGPMP